MSRELTPLEVIENRITELRLRYQLIGAEIEALDKAAAILRPYAEFDAAPQAQTGEDVGITDAVRNALKNAVGSKLTAVQVRDLVARQGFDLDKYTNAMATIHQILRRLVIGKEVSVKTYGGEKPRYKWVGQEPKAASVLNPLLGAKNLDALAALKPPKFPDFSALDVIADFAPKKK